MKKVFRSKKFLLLVLGLVVCLMTSLLISLKTISVYAANDADGIQEYSAPVEQTGLGLGINVVTARNYNDFSNGYNILDNDKLAGLKTFKININLVSGQCSFNRCTNGCSFVGGITGIAHNATFENCHNYVVLTTGRYSCAAGGISAYAVKSTFIRCSNNANIYSYKTGAGGYAHIGFMVGQYHKDSQYENIFYSCSCLSSVNGYCKNYGVGSTYKFALEQQGRSTSKLFM